MLWDDRIHWQRQEEGRPAGELRFGPSTKVQRGGGEDADSCTLSIAYAGRELMLRGTAQEVRSCAIVHLSACYPATVCTQIGQWEAAVTRLIKPSRPVEDASGPATAHSVFQSCQQSRAAWECLSTLSLIHI